MPQESDRSTPPQPTSQERVYVLRIWREPGVHASGLTWRASLREGTLAQRRYFASIDDCIDHLYSEFTRS
ncbi:hypothetical protein [Deinococcus humi]|uniref:Uncharacterized protein n=1 Tax=Deinococcus humi TaxID=662880 RepID=A0A7W8JV70_9DEIO|nr:hypothetical protein [Deinococcus humi]MBB5363816.1 hypothetical protein [Deinococcus humi]GGO31862.1 hypothetical protein GCM10008949_28550 [Deinococcus humi]